MLKLKISGLGSEDGPRSEIIRKERISQKIKKLAADDSRLMADG